MKNKIHNTNIEKCCVFCLSSFCVFYPMLTAAHSWLSRQYSMFVLCILFVFVLFIASNVYSCPFLVVPSVFVNIGYNTQNEDKQNTQHKHRKPTGQPGMGSCKHWIQYTERRQSKYTTQTFVFCLSSFCVLYPIFTTAHSWLSCRFSMFVLCILFFFVLCIVSNVYSCPFLVVLSVFYATQT
jgi:hypothetical protein